MPPSRVRVIDRTRRDGMEMSASSLLDAIGCWIRVLAQKLDPGLLGARVALGGFDEIEEPDERLVEPIGKCLVGQFAVAGECPVGLSEREHVRVHARAEMLERHAQGPEAAVAAD